jgi:hypothetical protein
VCWGHVMFAPTQPQLSMSKSKNGFSPGVMTVTDVMTELTFSTQCKT